MEARRKLNPVILSVIKRGLALLVLSVVVIVGFSFDSRPATAASVVNEGNDFATRVLRDPWDMNALSDVYWGLGQSAVTSVNLQNGIFSAISTTAGGAYFNTLFPGYDPSRNMQVGKIGALYPINSSTYSCLYVSMNTHSNPGFDYVYATWFSDFSFHGGAYGFTKPKQIVPNVWNLYRIDLNADFSNGTQWSNRVNWQGLQILPTSQNGVPFEVNWVRLTDCVAVNQTINWTPTGGNVSISIQPSGTGRQIQVASGISGSAGSYALDVQGVMPGSYSYTVVGSSGTVRSGQFQINQAPVVTFLRPAPESGEDYSTVAGTPWDMNASSSITGVQCASYGFQNGSLILDTLPPSMLPGNCVGQGVGEADPKIFLNTPVPANVSQYRYLSLRHTINGTIPAPENGLIGRFFWTVNNCAYTSKEFAFDIGWQTYRIDMFDPSNTVPVASNCSLTSWQNQTSSVTGFRFDPNENITSGTLHQEIDWIRMTKIDSVKRGVAFPIQLSLNKSTQGITFNFYYTNNLQQPTQSAALPYSSTPPSPAGPFSLYLPLVLRLGWVPIGPNMVTFEWDTSSVPPGQYYTCARADDGYNSMIYCSDAPVTITA